MVRHFGHTHSSSSLICLSAYCSAHVAAGFGLPPAAAITVSVSGTATAAVINARCSTKKGSVSTTYQLMPKITHIAAARMPDRRKFTLWKPKFGSGADGAGARAPRGIGDAFVVLKELRNLHPRVKPL